MLRQVVVGWEVLLIEVQAVALSLEAKLLVLDHRYLKGHVLTTGPLGGEEEVGHHGGLQGGCGNGDLGLELTGVVSVVSMERIIARPHILFAEDCLVLGGATFCRDHQP